MARKIDIDDEFEKMRQGMRRMLERSRKFFSGTEYIEPLSDVYETEDELIFKIEVPGVKKEDIKINIEDNRLNLKVTKKEELEKKEEGFYISERAYTGFYRNYLLPDYVDEKSIKAKYKDGILELKVKKKVPDSKKNYIKIE